MPTTIELSAANIAAMSKESMDVTLDKLAKVKFQQSFGGDNFNLEVRAALLRNIRSAIAGNMEHVMFRLSIT